MSHTINLPVNVYDRMWAGFVTYAARDLVKTRSAEPDGILVHGDDLGAVLAWWWREDADTAVRFLGEYVAEVRRADPFRGDKVAAQIRLHQVLYGLPSALSIGLTGDESRAFVARAQTELD